ncbi:MAG TPA: hypothetical protein VFF57_06860, partial [Hanamia sp.]|nr:hypothetical protein [Hanamia sp.]
MKKIFPIITVLVFVSLLGIIFFQVVWIKQALQDKELQFEEAIKMVTVQSARDLEDENAKLSQLGNRKNADLLFPLQVFPSTIAHNFSLQEVGTIINKEFERNNIRDLNFEFAVTTTSMIGDDLQSKNFYTAYSDTINNRSFIFPLSSGSTSFASGLAPQELLIVVVPHVKNLVWKQMVW